MKTLGLFLILLSGCWEERSGFEFGKNQEIRRLNAQSALEVEVNFTNLKKFILTPHCLNCHNQSSNNPAYDPIDFSSLESMMIERYEALINPGDAQNSRLYQSVHQQRMPLDEKLNIYEIDFLRRWINYCAPSDC